MDKQKIYKVPDIMDKLLNDVISGLYFPLPDEDYTNRVAIIKCNVICDLLLHTDLSLDKIADSAGLSCIENINPIFKKFIGIGPNEFRKRFKTNSGV